MPASIVAGLLVITLALGVLIGVTGHKIINSEDLMLSLQTQQSTFAFAAGYQACERQAHQ